MIGPGSDKNYMWQYFEVCTWARKSVLFSIFLHVHRNLGTKHKEATNRLGEDPFSPKDASSGKPGSLTVEPWWTRGGRALVGWFHDEATNGQSGPSCPHCRSNHLFNDQTPDKKLSLNTFLSNLIGTVHKLHKGSHPERKVQFF